MSALAHSLSVPRVGSPLRAVASTRPRSLTAAAPKLRYIVVILSGIFAILGGQLMLSIAVSGGAYEISGLKAEVRDSHQQLQIVAEDIGALTAPDTLATLASSMGMVEDNNPAYLRLSDATVIGEAIPASLSNSRSVVSVTAGTEVIAPPAIIAAVYDSVSQAAAPEATSLDELAMLTQEAGATVTPVSSAPAATVSTAMVMTQPPVRFGGTIPSPTTR